MRWIVRRVDLAAVAVGVVTVAVAIGKLALARCHDAAASVAAARSRLRDHARPATVRVAAIVRISARNAAPAAGLLIREATLLQGVGANDERARLEEGQHAGE